MKRILLLAVAGLMAGAASLMAQPPQGPEGAGNLPQMPKILTPEEKTAQQAEKYSLTEEQKAALLELNKEYDSKLASYDFGARYYTSASATIPRWTTMDPLCEKYYSISPYAYCAGNPVRFLDPDGERIVGVTREDADNVVHDLHTIFRDDVFEQFRKLIVQSGKKQNGRSLAKIKKSDLKAAFDGIELTEDQQALVDIVVNTINSSDEHLIEYVNKNDHLSPTAVFDFSDSFYTLGIRISATEEELGGVPASVLFLLGGGGTTIETSNGSHSVIIIDGSHPYGIPSTVGHELFGHGRSLALGRKNQHVDSIQAENLILRVMGIPYQRDGRDHMSGEPIENTSSIPSYR